MEIPELGTLKPCLNPAFNFSPHRRRPLRSQTYQTFVRIMSHCNALQSSSETRNQGQDGNGGDKLREVGEEEMVNESFMELESSLVQQMSPLHGAKAHDALKNVESIMANEVDMSDVMGTLKQGNEELTPDNNVNHMNPSIVNNTSSVAENHSNSIPEIAQIVSGNEPVNSSMSMEMISDVPKPVRGGDEKSPTSMINFSEGIEHEVQLKQRELERLISSSGDLDLSVYDFAEEVIEEGEISGGNGVDVQAIDLLFEDDDLLEEKKLDEVLNSGVDEREVVSGDDGDGREGKCNVKSSLSLDKVECDNDIMKLERNSGEKQIAADQISTLEIGWIKKQGDGLKESNSHLISSENLAQRGQITYEDITENKDSATLAVEVGVVKKKRGPPTKERKAKKKKKERIKRAEKNRKLGVKRLKLQPVLKPKKVEYCRHYQRGRCQEGEKCKFSHDTTPLTKSKPCSFFARHSCMKGDDCPFDHQLSKYPCDNFVTNGFCSRGADCLFKHEVSSTNDASLISKLSKPELSSQFPTSGANSKNQVNKEGIAYQHPLAKFSAVHNSTGKFGENQVPKNQEKSVAQVPKGICLISHVRSPTGSTSKHEEPAPSIKVDNCVKISSGTVCNQSDSIKKSNETLKGLTLGPPKGINFLSFGKSPLDDSAKKEGGTSGSLSDQLTKTGLLRFSPKSDGTSSVTTSVVNKVSNEVSTASTPEAINFLSVGNAGAVRQSSIGSSGLKISGRKPYGSASSTLPLRPSLNRGAGNYDASSSKTPVLLNAPNSVQRALQSTLDFAAKMDSEIRFDRPIRNPFDVSKKT